HQEPVYIRHIFLVKPLMALAVLMCLATLIALFRLNRKRPHARSDQFLIAFIGLLTIYQGLRILKDAGGVTLTLNGMVDGAIEMMVATTSLIAAMMLKLSRINHLEAESAMRLARAAPPRLTRQADAPLGQKDLAMVETLNWAVPRLSDAAFKLFAFLCL